MMSRFAAKVLWVSCFVLILLAITTNSAWCQVLSYDGGAGGSGAGADPSTQGFSTVVNGGWFAFGPPPLPVWQLNSHTGQDQRFYESGVFAANAALTTTGFSAKANTGNGGVTTGTNPLNQSQMIIKTGGKNFSLYWHEDGAHAGSGNGGVYYENSGGSAALVSGTARDWGGSGYTEADLHTYEVTFTPDGGLGGTVKIFEDDSLLQTLTGDDFADSNDDMFGAASPAAGANVGESRMSVQSLSLSIVPEPGTMSLALMGLLGMGAVLYRRRFLR